MLQSFCDSAAEGTHALAREALDAVGPSWLNRAERSIQLCAMSDVSGSVMIRTSQTSNGASFFSAYRGLIFHRNLTRTFPDSRKSLTLQRKSFDEVRFRGATRGGCGADLMS